MNDPAPQRDIFGFALAVFAQQVLLVVCTFVPRCHIPLALAYVGCFMAGVTFWLGFVERRDDDPFYVLKRRRGASETEPTTPEFTADELERGRALLRRLSAVFALCCCVMVAGSFYGLRHGSAEMQAGECVAGNYKLRIPYRKITEAEYWRLTRHEVRLLASGSLLLSVPPVMSGIWIRSRRRRKREQGG